jgi:hypothetical protein
MSSALASTADAAVGFGQTILAAVVAFAYYV